MSKKLIACNWKQYVTNLAQAETILESVNEQLESLNETKEFSLVFCPPFVLIEDVAKVLDQSHLKHEAELGAQDIAFSDAGALTGEVSGEMLSKSGVRYVIVGHSDRRWKLNESDQVVNQKLKEVLRHNLVPIVCLGEKERNGPPAGGWQDFLRQQTEATFAGLSGDEMERCIIAYEPVWAISSTPGARPDTPDSAVESVKIIEATLAKSLRCLYGGSITSVNVTDFLTRPEFAGVLIGGASVNKEEFVKILSHAAQL